ncbi:MAG: outer membrane protein transport protein, partial [Planctomycetaceae bacterium]|nr:outer membrane protein transport protein [Planctomycetaceae bacterium]
MHRLQRSSGWILQRRCLPLVIVLGWCYALAGSLPAATAQGIFLTGIGPINQAMGGAAVAAPLDSAGALNWNPATISGLQSSEMAIGLGAILPTTELSSEAFGLSGSTRGNSGVTPVPTMSFVLKSDDSPWSLGIGVYAIGGFSSNFPSNPLSPQSNPILTPQPPTGVGVGRIFSRAEIYQVAPTIAYAVTEKLSIGFAPTIDLANVQADPNLFAPPNVVLGVPTYGPGTGSQFAWGGGYQLGVYYILSPAWRLGASYKSEQWFEKLHFNSNNVLGNPVFNSVQFNLPSITSIGFAYTGINRLLWAVDVRYFDYDSADGFNGSGYRPDGSVAGLGWNGVVGVSNGVQFAMTERFAIRAGYTFIENPIPPSQENFNVATSLSMQHFLSCGFSYRFLHNVMVNVAYTHGFQDSLTGPYV